jgi:hypothetical protein
LEPELALYGGGDLGVAEAARLEAHVVACASCREFLASVERTRATLGDLYSEPLSPAAYAVVRARVMAALGGAASRPTRRLPVWSWALAASLVLSAAGLLVLRARPLDPKAVPSAPSAVWRAPASPAATTAAKASARRVASAPAARKSRAAAPRAAASATSRPTVIKLLTDDPEIVIYWLLDEDTNGGRR